MAMPMQARDPTGVTARVWRLLPFLAYPFCASSPHAQEAYLVKDINETFDPYSFAPEITNVGGIAFFVADDGLHGLELWKSAGGAADTDLVKDIVPGSETSYPSSLTEAGGNLFFLANDRVHGFEVWRSDGTARGTILLGDLTPGPDGLPPESLTRVGRGLYFVTRVSEDRANLWKSDGTPEGTVLVKEVPATLMYFGSYPRSLAEGNGLLYFVTSEPGTGAELWRSDGTTQGTSLFMDVVLGPESSSPASLAQAGPFLYFQIQRFDEFDRETYQELWRSDGTANGTILLNYLRYDAVRSLINLGGRAFFVHLSYGDEGLEGFSLWTSDGSQEGTRRIKSFDNEDIPPRSLAVIGNTIVFLTGIFDSVTHLWTSDGSASGTTVIAEVPSEPNILVVSGSQVFFKENATRLWRSNGLPSGTFMIKDFAQEGIEVVVDSLVDVGGDLFLSTGTSTDGRALWKSNGTSEGTDLIRGGFQERTLSSLPSELTASGGQVLLRASHTENIYRGDLWKSFGSNDTTTIVKHAPQDPNSVEFYQLTDVEGMVFYLAYGPESSTAIWRTDGTEQATQLVKEFHDYRTPAYFTDVGGTLFFLIFSDSLFRELWKSDGTPEGTILVESEVDSFGPLALARSGIFFVRRAAEEITLRKTNGMPGTSALVKSFGDEGGQAGLYALTGGEAGLCFFLSKGYDQPTELWKSDGTPEGTIEVLSFPGFPNNAAYYPLAINVVGGTTFIFMSDGLDMGQLWTTDGTEFGTFRLKTFELQPFSPDYPEPLGINGTLYFRAGLPTIGTELWRSDGTSNGTFAVMDIYAGTLSSDPREFSSVQGHLYFSADDGLSGRELWKSDGTRGGTNRVQDIFPGPRNSNPRPMAIANGILFFAADDGVHGEELWGLPLSADRLRGDADGNGRRNITDVIYMLECLFRGGPCPSSLCKADANSDEDFDISDVIAVLLHLFLGVSGLEPCL